MPIPREDAADLVAQLQAIQAVRPDELSEADTRARLIDPLLRFLGWTHGEVRREPYAGWSDARGYIDYLLLIDARPAMVIEAKRSGRSFQVPDALSRQTTTNYRKLHATGSLDLREALEQCLRYAQFTGALYACATNGLEWIFFKPAHPYRSLPEARVLVFPGVPTILANLNQFEDVASRSGIEEGRCEKSLLGREIVAPTFAKRLRDVFPYRREPSVEEQEYSHLLDQMLRHYVIDLTSELDFDECYIPVKGNSRTASSLDALISSQVAALAPVGEKGASEFGNDLVGQPALPNVIAGRTVILHGAIGTGKSSFLRHCEMTLRKAGKLQEAVWVKVDLLPFQDRAFEIESLNQMLVLLCSKIQSKVSESTDLLSGRYDPDAWDHLRDIYNQEVRKFQKARFPDSDDSDAAYIEEARKFVWDLSRRDPQDHLVRVIRWLTVHCRLPVVVVLDNSDQLGLGFQEFLYKLCETLQQGTCALTVLVLRTEALLSHRIREHSLASVAEQFSIQRAPLARVLQKRFERVARAISQDQKAEAPEQLVARERVSVLMDTLQYEAELGSETFRLVDAIGEGNLRDSLRAIAAIFRASPKFMDKLVAEQNKHKNARLPLSRAIRALLKDDLTSVDPKKLIPNIFMVESQVTIPYSLGFRMLQQVKSKAGLGEYPVGGLLSDFALAGVDRSIAARVLSRLRNDRFLAVSHMLAELRDVDVLRVTALGDVMLELIILVRDYRDQMVFETVIYDRALYNDLRSTWNSGGEFVTKFSAMGKMFAEAVSADDKAWRRGLNISILEPSLAGELPGPVYE
jgi:hypothetical protein